MKFDAVVFDFDGVLVESTHVKTRTFGQLYAGYGQKMAKRIVDYHLAHAGMSRYVKFKVWQEEFLGLPYTEADGERLSLEFSRLVVDEVVAAPYVPGAEAFLAAYHRKLPLCVASGTPESELQEIVHRRRMSHFFRSVHGAPASKGQILAELILESGFSPDRVLMVGDAMADWQGAQEVGTAFIGRVGHEAGVEFPRDTALISDLVQLSLLLA
jgi:phosphoglycolate phosphatase-like HAD superfamily hydrolase